MEALSARVLAAIKNARLAGVFVFVLALSGCASLMPQTAGLREGLPAGLPERVEIESVPFFPQKEYQCGPAALATALAHFGAKVTPEALVPQVWLPARKGSLQVEMVAAARRHGMVSYVLEPRFDHLLREIAAGNPVIVLQHLGAGPLGLGPFGDWHYAVAVGYDYAPGELILRSGVEKRETLPFGAHEITWAKGGYWAMVALPPDRMPATVDPERWLASIAALERAGDAKNAGIAYAKYLERWPANLNAAIGLANTQHARGELGAAEATLRAAATRAPDSVIVLNNLAQTLADQGRHREALPFAERAVAAGGPFRAAAEDTRRQILEKLGKAARK